MERPPYADDSPELKVMLSELLAWPQLEARIRDAVERVHRQIEKGEEISPSGEYFIDRTWSKMKADREQG